MKRKFKMGVASIGASKPKPITISDKPKVNRTYVSKHVIKVEGVISEIEEHVFVTTNGIRYKGNDEFFRANNHTEFYYKDNSSITGYTKRIIINQFSKKSIAFRNTAKHCFRYKPGTKVIGYIENNIFHGLHIVKDNVKSSKPKDEYNGKD